MTTATADLIGGGTRTRPPQKCFSNVEEPVSFGCDFGFLCGIRCLMGFVRVSWMSLVPAAAAILRLHSPWRASRGVLVEQEWSLGVFIPLDGSDEKAIHMKRKFYL